jgi:hypothetical protein
VLVAGAVPDQPTDVVAHEVRHPPSGRSGRHATGFEDHDPIVAQPRLVEQAQRDDGGLPGTGGRLQHREANAGQRPAQVGHASLDR